ncbi:uncharacterized protein LOC144688958 isoform X2 [Cetorhinus maximus]
MEFSTTCKTSKMCVLRRSVGFITFMILVQNSITDEECATSTLVTHYQNVISVLLDDTIERTNSIIQSKNNTSLHRNRTGHSKVKSSARTKPLVCEILRKTKALNFTSESYNNLQESLRSLRLNTNAALEVCVGVITVNTSSSLVLYFLFGR